MFITVNDLILIKDRVIISIMGDLNRPLTVYLHQALYAVVTPIGQTPVTIDVNKLISVTPNVMTQASYQDFLTGVVTNALVLQNVQVANLPKPDPVTRRYTKRLDVQDGLGAAGWGVDYGVASSPGVLSDILTLGTAPDLILTPPPGVVPQNILISVNGVFHATIVIEGLIYVIDGYQNMRESGQVALVLCDTTTLGGHQIIPITPGVIVSPDTTLSQEVTLEVPTPSSLINTTVMVVVDGYLQLPGPACRVVNGQCVQLVTSQIDLIGNFIHNPNMRYKTSLFNIPNRPNPFSPDESTPVTPALYGSDATDSYLDLFVSATSVANATVMTPAFIKSRLQSVHSFIVVINNPLLFVLPFGLQSNTDPQIYSITSRATPRGLFFNSKGKVLPYTVASAQDGEHEIYLSYVDQTKDLYRTAYQPELIPSARADVTQGIGGQPAHMIEFYSR